MRQNYLTQNMKMMKIPGTRTFNWGIPALVSRDGFVTCPSAGACAVGCFARAGWYVARPVVVDAYHDRLALSQDRERFREVIPRELERRRVERLRIHDSGDFYSEDYLRDWIAIMEARPEVDFYTYTKRVRLLKAFQAAGELPHNFSVTFSFGGQEDRFIDPAVDAHCRVFESADDLEAAGYQNGTQDDAIAASGARAVGLVYHGQRSYRNTRWGEVR